MMKLAMAQMAMSKDMEANFQKSYDFVRQAAGADLIFFPEVQHMPFLPQYEAAELPENWGRSETTICSGRMMPTSRLSMSWHDSHSAWSRRTSISSTADKPLDTPIQFHAVENMTGCDMKALNLSQDAMEALCVKQLKKGQAIWFACDAGAFGARKEGIWDPDSVCYEALLMYSYDDRMRAVKLKSIWQN